MIDAWGLLSLEGVTIEDAEVPVHAYGGVYVVHSHFRRNSAAALSIRGDAWVEDSTFVGNDTGLSVQRGRVVRAEFRENRTGALRAVWPDGELKISDSKFIGNKGKGAIEMSQRSGQGGNGIVIVRRSIFDGNTHADGGGAITIYDFTKRAPNLEIRNILLGFPPARFGLFYNDFIKNLGTTGAVQADLANSDGLEIVGGTFIGNEGTGYGGAISWANGPVSISHSLFRGNRAGLSGGALYAGAETVAPPQQEIVNTLIVENEAPAPGAVVDVGAAALVNVTVAENKGIGVVGRGIKRPIIANTILSGNTDGNCRDIAAEFFLGGNLQFGHEDCPGVTVGDPRLDAAYVPDFGSPALKLGDLSICTQEPVARRDIAFQGRGYDGTCAVGAFEYFPMRHFSLRDRPGKQIEKRPTDKDQSSTVP